MNIGRIALWASIALAVIILVFIVLATIFGWWLALVTIVLPAILYVVLIVAALTSAGMLFFLIRAVVNLTQTVREIRAEVLPVLDSLRTTSTAVRETAKAATSFGVAPAVRTASFVVGATEIASVVFGRGRTRKRSQERQKRRQEYEREMAHKEELDGR